MYYSIDRMLAKPWSQLSVTPPFSILLSWFWRNPFAIELPSLAMYAEICCTTLCSISTLLSLPFKWNFEEVKPREKKFLVYHSWWALSALSLRTSSSSKSHTSFSSSTAVRPMIHHPADSEESLSAYSFSNLIVSVNESSTNFVDCSRRWARAFLSKFSLSSP